jgi:hypothetical protein
MLENDIQEESKSEKSVEEARISLMKGLLKDAGETFDRLKNNPEASAAFEREKQRAVRQAVLAGLILVELAPGAENLNDVTKEVSMAEKIKNLVKESGPEVVKVAKSAGLIKDLYPDIPTWFMTVFEAIDVASVPILGAAPEALQFLIDGFYNTSNNRITIVKEAVKTYKDVREQRRGNINQAKAVFNNNFVGVQNG